MTKHDKMRLWEVSFDRILFRKELEKIVSNTSRHEILKVLKYCYDKYSDEHTEILYEVFSNHIKKQTVRKFDSN
jgi:hypothetical protein